MKKRIWSALLCLLLCSCEAKDRCYKCSPGAMVVSSFVLPFEEISQTSFQEETLPEGVDPTYINFYLLSSLEEKEGFYMEYGEVIDDKEENYVLSLPQDQKILYGIAQIPAGYLAYKRDNVQDTIKDEWILVTDNLYCYHNQPEIFYLQIDITKSDLLTEVGTFSFYYILRDERSSKIDPRNIIPLYSLSEV